MDYSYESIDTDNAKDNATGRIQQISYGKINNSFSDFSLKYEYDTLGRIVKVSDTKGNILAQYSYDAQGQLLMEKLPQQNKRYEYTYDTVGNIQEAKTYTLTGTTATATKKYTYGDASWNDLLTAYDGKEIIYDGAGNPLAYNNGTAWKFTWEKGRELSSASADGKNITFTYDVDGIRDSKTINGVKHEYVTLDGLIYQEKWGNNTLTFSYDNNDKPYAVKYNNTTYYYVLNQQGDVIRIVDENGTTKAEYTYDAWGNVIASTGTDSGIGAVNPLLYRGYYYDSELGMYYLRSRYYDPGVKRFINADSVDYLGENKTELSYNLFAYCENDAVNQVDHNGTYAIVIYAAVVFSIAVSSFIAYKTLQKITYVFIDFVNEIISICGKKVKKQVLDISKAVAKAVEKGKKKPKTKKKNVHHIIARTADRARLAQHVWTIELRESINSSRNLVPINQNFHQHLHNIIYYDSVNCIIGMAYYKNGLMDKRKRVYAALSVIKTFLLSVSRKF